MKIKSYGSKIKLLKLHSNKLNILTYALNNKEPQVLIIKPFAFCTRDGWYCVTILAII